MIRRAKIAGLFQAAALLLLLSCAKGPQSPQLLHSRFEALKPVEIALAPVIFADRPLDRYYEQRAGEEILRHARRVLENKGYRVTTLEAAGEKVRLADPELADTELSRLAGLAPEGAGGVMAIRVDHFLDAGVQSGKGYQFLEIYATAFLLSAGTGEQIWRDEGKGMVHGPVFSPGTLHMELFYVPAELAASLFDTLPKASSSSPR